METPTRAIDAAHEESFFFWLQQVCRSLTLLVIVKPHPFGTFFIINRNERPFWFVFCGVTAMSPLFCTVTRLIHLFLKLRFFSTNQPTIHQLCFSLFDGRSHDKRFQEWQSFHYRHYEGWWRSSDVSRLIFCGLAIIFPPTSTIHACQSRYL